MIRLRSLLVPAVLWSVVSACTVVACTSDATPIDASDAAPIDSITAACARWTQERDNGWWLLKRLLAGGRQFPKLGSDLGLAVLSPDDLKRVTEARRIECVHVVTQPGSNLTAGWLEACHAAFVGGTDLRVCALPAGSLALGEKVTAFWQCASMTLAFDPYSPDGRGSTCGTSPGLGGACEGMSLGYLRGYALPDCGYGLQCDDHTECPPSLPCEPGPVPNTCVAAESLGFSSEEPFDAGPAPPPSPVVKLGEPCLGAQCESGLYCHKGAEDPVARCVQRRPAGASCADEPPESCIESAYCEYCGGAVAGQCTPPTPTCIALKPLGGACAHDSECGGRGDPTLRCEPTCKPGQENACVVLTEKDARLLAPGEIGPSVAQCVYGDQVPRHPCNPCPRIAGHGEACDLNAQVDVCGYLGMKCRASRCVFDWE